MTSLVHLENDGTGVGSYGIAADEIASPELLKPAGCLSLTVGTHSARKEFVDASKSGKTATALRSWAQHRSHHESLLDAGHR